MNVILEVSQTKGGDWGVPYAPSCFLSSPRDGVGCIVILFCFSSSPGECNHEHIFLKQERNKSNKLSILELALAYANGTFPRIGPKWCASSSPGECNHEHIFLKQERNKSNKLSILELALAYANGTFPRIGPKWCAKMLFSQAYCGTGHFCPTPKKSHQAAKITILHVHKCRSGSFCRLFVGVLLWLWNALALPSTRWLHSHFSADRRG